MAIFDDYTNLELNIPQEMTNPGAKLLDDGAFIDLAETVISYKGENFYKPCDVVVESRDDGSTSHCIKHKGHIGVRHEDFLGIIRDDPIYDYSDLELENAVQKACADAVEIANQGAWDMEHFQPIANALMKRVREAGPIYG